MIWNKEYRTIKKSGFFDKEYYLKNYPDVKQSDIDPLKHFVKYGWKEGKNPSEKFDINFYLDKYPDVRDAKINPLMHFLQYGSKEGRKIHNENGILVEHKFSKIEKIISIGRYVRNNPHLVKKFIREVRNYGLKDTLEKSNLKLSSHIKTKDNNLDIDLFIQESLYKKFNIEFSELNTVKIDNNKLSEMNLVKIAIHLHLYYIDLVDYFITYFNKMPYKYDLFVSIVNLNNKDFVEKQFREKLTMLNKVYVEDVPNRGRDIAPFIVQFGERLLNYEYIAHIHSKKSPQNKKLDNWLNGIMDSIFESDDKLQKIMTLLSTGVNFIYPDNKYENVCYHNGGWSCNYEIAKNILNKYTNIDIEEYPYIEFPQGFMFWTRNAAIHDFLSLPFTYSNFDVEPIHTDGSFAHALERLPFIFSSNTEGNNYRIKNYLLDEKIVLDKVDNYSEISMIKQLILFGLQNKQISLSIVHMEVVKSLGGVQRYLWFDSIALNNNCIDTLCIFKSLNGVGIIINNKLIAEDLKFEMMMDIISLLIEKYDITLSIHHCINWKILELEYFLNLEIPIITFFHDDFWLKTKHFNKLFSATDDLDDDKAYSSFYEKLIDISEKLVFPSEFISNKFINSSMILEGCKNKVEVSPNLILERNITNIVKRKNKKLKIAYLGYKAEHKGWNLFESLLLDKNIVDQYDIYHIGADDLKKSNSYTKVLANYKNQTTTPELLLKEYDIDIVLLFSKLEESYSYTMYEAIASQSCIVTSDCSGNISHIIEKNQAYGKIFSSELSVIDFFNDYNIVLDWTLKNPNKNEIITHHNSFILKYIKEGKQC